METTALGLGCRVYGFQQSLAQGGFSFFLWKGGGGCGLVLGSILRPVGQGGKQRNVTLRVQVPK